MTFTIIAAILAAAFLLLWWKPWLARSEPKENRMRKKNESDQYIRIDSVFNGRETTILLTRREFDAAKRRASRNPEDSKS